MQQIWLMKCKKTTPCTGDGKARLRIHHLLCVPLYSGHGYSGPFCENMESVIAWLHAHRDEQLTAVCEPDMICAGCPNLTPDHACKSSGSSVEQKDEKLADALGILPGESYTYRQLQNIAGDQLTKEIFVNSCKNCEWFAQGLCSFEKWRAGTK